jgi:predicted nucleic acid-binding protein
VTTYLLDTNVVVRLLEPSAPEHNLVVDVIRRLLQNGHTLALAPQVLTELWVVATRPVDVNGFGWPPSKTAEAIVSLRGQFPLLTEGPGTFERWLSLATGAEIRGKRAHDARLAALLLSNGLTQILTLNTSDFEGLPGIAAVHPASV